jgi:hypothetical protein
MLYTAPNLHLLLPSKLCLELFGRNASLLGLQHLASNTDA